MVLLEHFQLPLWCNVCASSFTYAIQRAAMAQLFPQLLLTDSAELASQHKCAFVVVFPRPFLPQVTTQECTLIITRLALMKYSNCFVYKYIASRTELKPQSTPSTVLGQQLNLSGPAVDATTGGLLSASLPCSAFSVSRDKFPHDTTTIVRATAMTCFALRPFVATRLPRSCPLYSRCLSTVALMSRQTVLRNAGSRTREGWPPQYLRR